MRIRLKDNYRRGGRANQIPMAHHNLVAKLLNGARCIGGEVTLLPDGMVINPFMSAGGSGAELVEEFGIKSIVDATVTIYAGRIWIGETEIAAAETPLTLNTNSFVGWEHVFASGTLTIKNFGSTFTQIAGAVRKPLYYFTYSAGTVTRDRGLHLCDVFPANWGSYP